MVNRLPIPRRHAAVVGPGAHGAHNAPNLPQSWGERAGRGLTYLGTSNTAIREAQTTGLAAVHIDAAGCCGDTPTVLLQHHSSISPQSTYTCRCMNKEEEARPAAYSGKAARGRSSLMLHGKPVAATVRQQTRKQPPKGRSLPAVPILRQHTLSSYQLAGEENYG